MTIIISIQCHCLPNKVRSGDPLHLNIYTRCNRLQHCSTAAVQPPWDKESHLVSGAALVLYMAQWAERGLLLITTPQQSSALHQSSSGARIALKVLWLVMVIMVISPHKDNHGLTPPQQMSVPGDEGIRSSLRDSSQTCKGCFIIHTMNGQQNRLSLMKMKTITLVTLFFLCQKKP